LRLPRRVARQRVLSAKLDAETLTVHFSMTDDPGEDR
jgi:hypothetical protein